MASAFEALVELELERASAQGHRMANEGSSDKPGAETAFYLCQLCPAVFTVGYESSVDASRSSALRVIAATAAETPCPQKGPESSSPPASA